MMSHGAVMLVFDADRVLMQLREDFRVWSFPGGGIEPGERWEEAARREVLEETGYEVAFVREVGAYTRPHYAPGQVVHVGVGRVTGGQARPDPRESLAVAWFPVSALPARTLPWSAIYLADALANGPPVRRAIYVPRWKSVLWRGAFLLRDLRNTLFRREPA